MEKETQPEKKYCEMDDLTKRFGVDKSTIKRWRKNHGFPKRGLLGYRIADVDAWGKALYEGEAA